MKYNSDGIDPDIATDDLDRFMEALAGDATEPVKLTPDAALTKVEPSKNEQIPFFEDNEFDAVLDDFERAQQAAEKKRKDAKRKWEHKQQDELAEYNPQPAISHNSGIWDVPPRRLLK